MCAVPDRRPWTPEEECIIEGLAAVLLPSTRWGQKGGDDGIYSRMAQTLYSHLDSTAAGSEAGLPKRTASSVRQKISRWMKQRQAEAASDLQAVASANQVVPQIHNHKNMRMQSLRLDHTVLLRLIFLHACNKHCDSSIVASCSVRDCARIVSTPHGAHARFECSAGQFLVLSAACHLMLSRRCDMV